MKTKSPKKEKAKMGRPDKYKPEYCQMMKDFFDTEPYLLIELESTREYDVNGNIRKETSKKKPMPNRLPTFYKFAEKIGVDQTTLGEWKKKHKDFSLAFTRAKEQQKEFLMGLGLAGITPPAAFIFIASNLTDMKTQGVNDFPPGSVLVPVIVKRGTERLPEPEKPKHMDVRVIKSNESQEIHA